MIKAILMDFNGVIIDDEPIQMRAYQELLKGEGIDLSEEQYYDSLGMDDKTFVEEAYKRVGKTPEANKVLELTLAKSEKWREIVADGVPLFHGIDNFIRKMSQELALGIVSMSRRDDIDHVLQLTNLADCFSVIVSANDITKCKPDPECYREGFRLLDLARIAKGHLPMTHPECLVIEDSPSGVQSAKAADLPVLGVTNTVSADELRAAGAGSIAKDLNDWMPESVRRVFSKSV
ncbi:MAG TPA: HAD family phosphatase [Pyrinomonadaceae bacterium]|jgi:HAD superfamily hydrolase (TIGR01509 family)|nr:HAD family phosphatase [Pyrinomonadaceae bacterium]